MLYQFEASISPSPPPPSLLRQPFRHLNFWRLIYLNTHRLPLWAKTVFKFLTKCRIRYLFIYLFVRGKINVEGILLNDQALKSRVWRPFLLNKSEIYIFQNLYISTYNTCIPLERLDHSGWNFPPHSDNFFSNFPPRG